MRHGYIAPNNLILFVPFFAIILIHLIAMYITTMVITTLQFSFKKAEGKIEEVCLD